MNDQMFFIGAITTFLVVLIGSLGLWSIWYQKRYDKQDKNAPQGDKE